MSSGQVGPQHPFLLLESAGNLNVDILRRDVRFAPVDVASNLCDCRDGAFHGRFQEGVLSMFFDGERWESRFPYGALDRPVRRPVPRDVALGCEICILSRLIRETIEQFMELRESWALQVPMGVPRGQSRQERAYIDG